MKQIIILISISCGLCACNDASEPRGEWSQNRSAAFKSFMEPFAIMGKMAHGDQAFEPDAFRQYAAQFSQQAKEPFQYFQNDPQGNGKALPIIWQKPNEFKTQEQQFLQAVQQLNQAAQAGKLEPIAIAVDKVEQQCQACHQTYRAP